jgi:hypothetical protein
MLRTWKTHEGEDLELDLTAPELELFEEALSLYQVGAPMADISNLYLDGSCVLYRGRTGPEVVKHPLYRAIKDMAKRQGIADGILGDIPGTRPALDSFEAKN